MPQVFRVGDLAQQMGVSVEELIFKLRSIGVDVTTAENTLDLSTVRDIITGQTLVRRPREVIVRQAAASAEEQRKAPAPPVDRLKRRRPGRRGVGLDEELPDEVPNLAALAVPASAKHAARAADEPERRRRGDRAGRRHHGRSGPGRGRGDRRTGPGAGRAAARGDARHAGEAGADGEGR